MNVTTTPSAWLLCANDDNDEVDNAEALANSATLASHGVPTVADLHAPSPLYDERGRGRALHDADGRHRRGRYRRPLAAADADRLAPAVRADVVDQIRVMQAEHQMYADWAAREIAFLDAHDP